MYTFTDLDDGVWKFQVEMLGFATQTQDIAIAADTPSPVWELKLLPLEEITRGLPARRDGEHSSDRPARLGRWEGCRQPQRSPQPSQKAFSAPP